MASYKLVELAHYVQGSVRGDPEVTISAIGGLEDVPPGGITYAENEHYLRRALASPAAAIVTYPEAPLLDKPLLLHPHPRFAFAQLLRLFSPFRQPQPGIHPTAIIGEECQLGDQVSIQPYAVVGDRARIGDRVQIYPFVYIGDEVEIGEDSIVYPHVVIMPHVRIGRGVIIHPGAIIGGDGYAYVQQNGKHHKIPQIGCVEIEEEVEIGCNTTIDRATTGVTRIGAGTKIDNLVQIGHNVQIGNHCLIVAQVGIAGSTVLEDRVVLAGQVGVKDHVRIGQGSVVGAQGGVTKNLPAGGVYWGSPAVPHRELLHVLSYFYKLPQLFERVQQLERKWAEKERE